MYFIFSLYADFFDDNLPGALLTIVPRWMDVPVTIGLYKQLFSTQT